MEGSSIKQTVPNVDNSSESDESSYQAYLDERRMLIDRKQEAHRDLDRWIMTMSGGSLGLSMTMLSVLIGSGWTFNSCWVLVSWILFGSSIVVVILNIWLSAKSYEEHREAIDTAASKNFNQWRSEAAALQGKLKKPVYIDVCNLLSTIFFAFGVVFLAVFAGSISV
ncbi:MAG: hypothetical protein JKX70_09415 [Phycisphaerales bacterium]|nr:hypothetical protein [Phycisphaerales bacterium]